MDPVTSCSDYTPDGPVADRLKVRVLDVHRLPLNRIRAAKDLWVQLESAGHFPIDLWRLNRLFRRECPDVVQLSSLMNSQAAYVAKAIGSPVVWQIVATRPPMPVRRVLMRQIRLLADVVMPIGEAVRDAHPGATGFGERCVLFFPHIDLEGFCPQGATPLHQELGIAPDARIVTVIGNINPQKGHEHFIRAASLVERQRPDTVFVVVGHPYDNHREYFKKLQRLAAESGLKVERDLHFLGSRSDIPDILRSSDVFALSSVPNSEGMPTVILEAMACGVLVVASDVASVKEAVVDGETGFVVPSLAHADMAARSDRLLGDDALRSSFGAAARAVAEARFSLKTYADIHVRAYELAVSNRKRRRGRNEAGGLT